MERHRGSITAFSLRKTGVVSGLVSPNERKCTNAVCAGLFWLSIIAMIGTSIYCWSKGNITALLAPTDGNDDICGVGLAYNYPYLFLPDIENRNLTQILDSGRCVGSCPANGEKTHCRSSGCPTATYDSRPIGFICFPKGDALANNLRERMAGDSGGGRYLQDMGISWKPAAVCLALGIVYTIIFMYALAYCTTCMAYISILVIEVAILGAAAVSAYYGINGSPTHIGTYWAFFGVFLIMWLLFNVLLCCCWSKVATAIAVIDATADFMVATFRLSFVSFGFSLLFGVYLALWLVSACSVLSMNEIEADPSSFNGKKITFEHHYLGMLIFICIVWLWIINFLLDQMSFITMSSAAQFYFSSNQKQEGQASVCTAIALSNLKHAGSIAFGSFIHTLLVVFHIINEVLQSAAQESDNPAAKCIACILRCFLACLEALIEWLTTLSYAMMSISGDGYCQSAWSGFILNLKHCVKFYMAVSIAKVFVFLGMLAVVAANCGTCYLLITYAFPEAEQVSSELSPIVTVGVVTFMTTSVFMGPFNDAVVATLLCFAVDMELNSGQPQFGPPSYQDKLKTITGDNSRTYSDAQRQMYSGVGMN